MKKSLQVIYVPGLGDVNPAMQAFAVNTWRWYGVRSYLSAAHWADKEAYAPKLERLLDLIDELSQRGDVCLVGASAGASMVINAFAARRKKVRAVVCICGKFNHPESVSPSLITKNPAFGESMDIVDVSWAKLDAADRQRILSIRPLYDESVPIRETMVPGVHLKRVWTLGHAITIATMISIRTFTVLRFLKAQAK